MGQSRAVFLDGGVDDGVAVALGHVVWELQLGETRLEGLQRRAVDVVRGDAVVEEVGALELVAGQRQVRAHAALHARQEEGRADVREEADGRLGHGEDGVFRRDAERRVDGEPDAAAHGDAVQEGHVGLVIRRDEVVQHVFQREVVGAPFLALGARLIPLGQLRHIAARAKGASLALDDYDACELGFLPFLESRDDLAGHGGVERVEFLGSVELDGAHAVVVGEDDIVGVVVVLGSKEVGFRGVGGGVGGCVVLYGSVRHVGWIDRCRGGVRWCTILLPLIQAGFVILARRGMLEGFNREAQLSGAAVRRIDVRRDMMGGRKGKSVM